MGRTWSAVLAMALGLAFFGAATSASHAQDVPAATATDAEQSVRDMLEATRKVAQAGDGRAYAAAWDATTVVKELLAEPDIAGMSKAKKSMLTMGVGFGLRQGFAEDPSLLAFARMEVRSVDLDDDRAVAVIRGWDEDDFGLTWRIWLVRRNDAWRIYDAEEVSQGIRISRLLLAAIAETLADGETPAWLSGLESLVAGSEASIAQDWESVEAHLAAVDAVSFPPDFEAMRSMLRGIVALQLHGDPVGTIGHAEDMVRRYPPTVAGELIRGRALLELERPSEVLPAVARYMSVTGPDATALQLRGEALHELGRHAEAITAMREASADSPADADVLATWLWMAEGDEHNEPLRVFKMLRNPEQIFETMVVSLREWEDAEAVERLFEAMAEVRPDHQDLGYWRALVRLESGDPDAGIFFLRPSLEAFRDSATLDDEEPWPWITLWCDLHAAAGSLDQAYDAMRGSRDGMIELATRMRSEGDVAALSELIDTYAEIEPDEPWLRVLRADVLLGSGRADEVEAMLAPILERKQDDTYDEALARLSAVLLQTESAVAGYGKYGADIFRHLAWDLFQAKQGEPLLDVVELHRKTTPGDSLLPFYRLHALYLTERYDAATALFVEEGEAWESYESWTVFDSGFRSALRAGEMDVAREVAERARDATPDHLPLVILGVVRGDAEAALTAIRATLDENVTARQILDDPDAEQALRTEGMRTVRAFLEARVAD